MFISTFRQLRVQGARIGIASKSTAGSYVSPWNLRFAEIDFSNISYTMISLTSGDTAFGMPINHLSAITCLNDGYHATGPAVRIDGEYLIDSLDVEGWAGPIVHTQYGNGAIRGCHIERLEAPISDDSIFHLSNGTFTLDQYIIHYASAVAGAHATVSALNVVMNIGAGEINTTGIAGSATMFLLRATGVTRIGLSSVPKHTGTASWYRGIPSVGGHPAVLDDGCPGRW